MNLSSCSIYLRTYIPTYLHTDLGGQPLVWLGKQAIQVWLRLHCRGLGPHWWVPIQRVLGWYVCMYVCRDGLMSSLALCMYVFMYVCMYVCMYVYVPRWIGGGFHQILSQRCSCHPRCFRGMYVCMYVQSSISGPSNSPTYLPTYLPTYRAIPAEMSPRCSSPKMRTSIPPWLYIALVHR